MRRKHLTCPECGGPMSEGARRCKPCTALARRGKRIGGAGRIGEYTEDAVYTVGRRESIITFGRGEERRTIHCFGTNTKGQTAYGRARLPEGEEWTVLCRSTPQSILADLRVGELSDKGRQTRRRYQLQAGQG